MNRLINKIKRMPNFKLILFFIYPILPLGILSSWVIIIAVFEFFNKITSRDIGDLVGMLVFMLWVFGGPAGIYAFISVLLKKRTSFVFWMFVYGLLSFSPIAIYFIFVGVSNFELLWMIQALYLTFGLIIITRECSKLYQAVF